MKITLPLTETCRKYGYIIWRKNQEAAVREIVGHSDTVSLLLPGDFEILKKVDWKHRRISIGYSQTRALPGSVTTIDLVTGASGRIEVSFR